MLLDMDKIEVHGGALVAVDADWSALRAVKPLADIGELWHEGSPEHDGLYLVVCNGKYRFSEYEDGVFAVHICGYVRYTRTVDKWCLIRRGVVYGKD